MLAMTEALIWIRHGLGFGWFDDAEAQLWIGGGWALTRRIG